MQSVSGLDMTSLGNDGTRGESDLERWYSGYLIVKHVSEDIASRLADLAKEIPSLDVYSGRIELEYKGRDSSHFILRALVRLARLVENADGEIVCQVSGDADQLRFEFYRIRDGRLFRQYGEVVRQPEHEVTDPGQSKLTG